MKITKRRSLGAAAATALAVAAVLALPSPAHAAQTSCTIVSPHISCSTGTIYAHPDHWVKLRVNVPVYGDLTCYLHDADNGIIVGQASRSSWLPSWAYTEPTFHGLYNRYFAVCINQSQTGTGRIRNS
jgi:hypothetical protein